MSHSIISKAPVPFSIEEGDSVEHMRNITKIMFPDYYKRISIDYDKEQGNKSSKKIKVTCPCYILTKVVIALETLFGTTLNQTDREFETNFMKSLTDDEQDAIVFNLDRRLCWKSESGMLFHALSVFDSFFSLYDNDSITYLSSMTLPPAGEKIIGTVSLRPYGINYDTV